MWFVPYVSVMEAFRTELVSLTLSLQRFVSLRECANANKAAMHAPAAIPAEMIKRIRII